MIDALMTSIFTVILSIIFLYKWIIIISAILTWVRPDPYNPIVQMLYRLTEPAYALVRRYIPTVFWWNGFSSNYFDFCFNIFRNFFKKPILLKYYYEI